MDLKQSEQEVLGVNLKKPVLNEHMHAHTEVGGERGGEL